jgi:hypothetical protein
MQLIYLKYIQYFELYPRFGAYCTFWAIFSLHKGYIFTCMNCFQSYTFTRVIYQPGNA